MHKVFNAIAIQNFKLSSPHVLVTLIYAPAAYHDRLEIISARLILVLIRLSTSKLSEDLFQYF